MRNKKRLIPSPPGDWKSWEDIMQLALEEASATNGAEVPVGALVLDEQGLIISKAHNQCIGGFDPSAHAELLALRQAALAKKNYRLNGCFLVVSLEPCLMCAGAIAHARLAGIVFGAYDLKAGAVNSCFDALDQVFLQHRTWHLGGILEEECAQYLQNFFLGKRK